MIHLKKVFIKVLNFFRYSGGKNQAKRYTRSRIGNFFFVFFLLLFGAFSVLPLVYCIATSFKPIDELLVFPPTFFVRRPTGQNYSILPELLSNLNVPLLRYIFNSIFVSAVITVLYVLFSAMAAFSICKSGLKGKNIYFAVIQFALLFNAYTLSIPQYVIISKLNIIDTYWAYILPAIASTMGVFLMKQFMEGSVPDALLEAARMDGASPIRIFFTIIIPIVKPALMTLTLFGFRDAWASIPNGTVFSEEIKTLPYIMTQIAAGGIARSGSSMAVTVIMMIPPILIYFITQSNVMETMSSAGIKE